MWSTGLGLGVKLPEATCEASAVGVEVELGSESEGD